MKPLTDSTKFLLFTDSKEAPIDFLKTNLGDWEKAIEARGWRFREDAPFLENDLRFDPSVSVGFYEAYTSDEARKLGDLIFDWVETFQFWHIENTRPSIEVLEERRHLAAYGLSYVNKLAIGPLYKADLLFTFGALYDSATYYIDLQKAEGKQTGRGLQTNKAFASN